MIASVPDDVFRQMVADALDSIPEALAHRMDNVQLVIEDSPSSDLVKQMGVDPHGLLGVYQGIPLTSRGMNYTGVLPDRIALFKRNIELHAHHPAEIEGIVRKTVIHEVAHHFGISDERLDELGWG